MKKFVINLETRHDRRREMEHQFRRVGWTDVEVFSAIRPEDPADFPSIGARGCFSSHLAILRQARGEPVAILEDDLNFVDHFPEAWDRALCNLPADWSIFYPAHYLEGARSGIQLLAPEIPIRCTHFVAFNAGVTEFVADELLAMLERPPGDPRGGPMHVDGAYSTVRRLHPSLKTYVHFPSLGYQRSSASDITPRPERTLLNPLRAALRRFNVLVRLKRRLMRNV